MLPRSSYNCWKFMNPSSSLSYLRKMTRKFTCGWPEEWAIFNCGTSLLWSKSHLVNNSQQWQRCWSSDVSIHRRRCDAQDPSGRLLWHKRSNYCFHITCLLWQRCRLILDKILLWFAFMRAVPLNLASVHKNNTVIYKSTYGKLVGCLVQTEYRLFEVKTCGVGL